MTWGSGSAGWSPWSRHTDISHTDISHPGARAWIILTGAGGLQGSWLSTVNYKPRKGHVSFQFVTSILRRKYRSDRVRCVKMLLWLSPCPGSGHRMLSANQRSESSQGDQWGQSHIPRILGLVTCDVWHMGGVSRDRGAWHHVTGSQVQRLNCSQLSDWLTVDKCLISLGRGAERKPGQVREEWI